MARYCVNCGTEVDESAVFCPTCGQPIEDGGPAEMPAAPSWPDPAAAEDRPRVEDSAHREEPAPAERRPEPEPETEPGAEPERAPSDVPTRVEQRPPPGGDAAAAPPPGSGEPHGAVEPGDERGDGGLPQIDLPITTPVTLSGWLIGIGSVLAALGLIVILIGTVLNVIDLLLLLAMVGVAATVFFTARLPAVPHLRLATLVVVLIAFGVALDRVGFRGGGAGELLLFMGSAAAAMGAIILELGQDQPLGGPQR